MNQNISKLHNIAGKKSRLIIGLMSGTSLDGLDVALCRFTGSGSGTRIDILAFDTIEYGDHFKTQVRSIFSKRSVDLEKVCLLNAWIAQQHAVMVLGCLEKWNIAPGDVDLIASHGQSIYHAPQLLHKQEGFGNATLQIGDGDHLAFSTGIITLSDFRQKHVAAGGEGAPLAVYGDYFIFSKKGENRIMLNIGGIANFTYLPADLDAGAIFSTDTGPGNTLMDAYVQQHFQIPYDKDSTIARKGNVNDPVLQELMHHPFFEKGFPKTTGPELFNLAYVGDAVARSGAGTLLKEDTLATLNRFSAETIAGAMKRSLDKEKEFSIYTSGGGVHNPLLMEHLQSLLPGYVFQSTSALNINPDAKEALLFAILANEAVAGGSIQIGNGKSDIPSVSMGKVSFPL
jgi:anhydro-N-acetylmuramic acid kinase